MPSGLPHVCKHHQPPTTQPACLSSSLPALEEWRHTTTTPAPNLVIYLPRPPERSGFLPRRRKASLKRYHTNPHVFSEAQMFFTHVQTFSLELKCCSLKSKHSSEAQMFALNPKHLLSGPNVFIEGQTFSPVQIVIIKRTVLLFIIKIKNDEFWEYYSFGRLLVPPN